MIQGSDHMARAVGHADAPGVVRSITVATDGAVHEVSLDGQPVIARNVLAFFRGSASACASELDQFLDGNIRTVRYLEYLRGLPRDWQVAVTAWGGRTLPPAPVGPGARLLQAGKASIAHICRWLSGRLNRRLHRQSPMLSALTTPEWEGIIHTAGNVSIRLLGRQRVQPAGAILLILDEPIISADWRRCRMALRLRYRDGTSESILLDGSGKFTRYLTGKPSVTVEEVTSPWTSMSYEVGVSCMSPAPRLREALGCLAPR